ncbi:hypothetical protein PG987_015724 [Apiospora arundinis]
MSASFTFGSFGDIITTAQLVWRLARALSDSCGSAPEFRELVVELNLFYGALYELTKFWQSRAQTAELQRLALEIQDVADDCRRMIDSFLDKGHKRYGKSFLKPKDAPKTIRDWFKRIRWASLEKEEANKMRDRLKRNKDIVDMIQSVAYGIAQERDSAIVAKRLASLETAKNLASTSVEQNFVDVIGALRKQEVLISRVDENIITLLTDRNSAHAQLSNIEREVTLLPRAHAALSMYTDNHAYIEDSLGSPFPVPLQINPSWEYTSDSFWQTIHSMIKDRFKDRPGNDLILMHNYVLQDPNTRSELQLTREFHSSVRPGQRLSMAMVFYGTAQRHLGGCLVVYRKCVRGRVGLTGPGQYASYVLLVVPNVFTSNNPDCGFTYREIIDLSDTSVDNLNNWLAGRYDRPQNDVTGDSSSKIDLHDGDDVQRILFTREASDGPEIFKRVKFLSRWEDREESRGFHKKLNNGVHFWHASAAGSGLEIESQIGAMTHLHLKSIPLAEALPQMDWDPIFPVDNIVFMTGFAGTSKASSVPVIIIFLADSLERKRIANWMHKLQVVKSSRIRVLAFHPLVYKSREQWRQDWEFMEQFNKRVKSTNPMLDASKKQYI